MLAAPLAAQDVASLSELRAGQDLLYRGRFGAAQLYFSRLAVERPLDPSGPALEASTLIWWAEARDDEGADAELIDSLLNTAIARARAADSAASDSMRTHTLFWLGTSYAYRARQAELRGSLWRAARDARAMQAALSRALAFDSTCVDCLLGLAVYDYALARASAVARVVARLIGLGGGDAELALERLRMVSEAGTLARIEARWVFANVLLREGERDPARREEGLRLIGELALRFPENPAFQHALTDAGIAP